MCQRRGIGTEDITQAAVASFQGAGDARLAEVLAALVRHLHAFAVEVGLSESEWQAAIGALTETGHITDERRQEFILWSDVLGLSMIVDSLANQRPGATESTVLGPFYVPGSPLRENGASIAEAAGGEVARVHGRVTGPGGEPLLGAELDVWQNGAGGLYAVQDPEAPEAHMRGRFRTGEDGGYAFLTVRPIPYTIPHDGPVGRVLEAAGRHPWRPAHIHVIVRAPGYQTLVTHIFDAASPYIDSDAVFAVKPSLLRTFEARPADDPEAPPAVSGTWFSVRNDLVLAPAEPG